jgi:hypothetical protein
VRFAGIDARNRLFVRLPGPIAFASGIRNFAEDESGIRREQRKSLVNDPFTRLFRFVSSNSAVRRGLEPLTPCVTGTYSNQLN